MENKKKNRYPDKLPYDHNRVLLNALANGTNSDYINASTVVSTIYIWNHDDDDGDDDAGGVMRIWYFVSQMDHDPRNPAYIVTQVDYHHNRCDDHKPIIVIITQVDYHTSQS